MALLNHRFGLTIQEDPKQFLGMNVKVHSPTRVTLTSKSYILQMADRHVPDWRSRATLAMPCTDKLIGAYERAHAREHVASPELLRSYGGKVGALMYTSPCVRVDACGTISRLALCRILKKSTSVFRLLVVIFAWKWCGADLTRWVRPLVSLAMTISRLFFYPPRADPPSLGPTRPTGARAHVCDSTAGYARL